eukprot:gene1439-2785_t
MSTRLSTVVIIGSGRNQGAFWSPNNKRLGSRVAEWVVKALAQRKEKCGEKDSAPVVEHDVKIIDPLEVFGGGGALAASGCELKAPHFFFKAGEAPPAMDALRDVFKAADAIVVVTAEYNHCVPPALLSILDHFGGSNFKAKPAGIVTYSPGPWGGGAHAAISIQPVLHELGALPVSKMVHLGGVVDILDEEGVPKDPEHSVYIIAL